MFANNYAKTRIDFNKLLFKQLDQLFPVYI